jgi:HEAT repeat protein
VATANLGKRITDLLDDGRVEMRCAAAMVLGATGKGQAATFTKALAKRLDDVAPVQRAALDALIELAAKGLSGELVPLLGSSDAYVRQKALELMAGQGGAAETGLRKQLTHGSVSGRAAVASMLAKRATASALDALFDQLADHDIGEHTLHVLRAEIDDAGGKARAAIQKAGGPVLGDPVDRIARQCRCRPLPADRPFRSLS